VKLSGMFICCRVRTSSGTFLNRDHDDVVRRIEERIARFSKIPFSNGESLQILHYGKLCKSC
jgi:prolyl 4-hydroxylase